MIGYKDKDAVLLPIGHSKSCSMTFFPNFFEDKKEGILYIDIAGLHDTSGI